MSAPRRFDPASLNDPVALATPWTPNSPGGASFRTHWLDTSQPEAWCFRATVGAWMFAGLFLLVGLGVCVPAVVEGARAWSAGDDVVGPGVGLAFGVLFAIAGGGMAWSNAQPIVFHQGRELYWRGFGEPAAGAPGVEPLGRVHALQVVSEACGSRTRFLSYELNLVFRDGRRVTVVDHGNLRALRADAARLAQFLHVPLWDPREP